MANYGIIHTGTGDVRGNSFDFDFGGNGDRQESNRKRHADVGVITVLSEEMHAVMKLLRGGKDFERKVQTDGRVVYQAVMPAEPEDLRVVAMQSTDSGQRSAVMAFEYLRQNYGPPVVVLVGIAGGIHKDLRLGDVVISSEIVYYDRRKTTLRTVLRRGDAKPIPARAAQMINSFFTEYREPASFSDDNGTFAVHRGPVGSGEAVVASSRSDIREYLLHYNDKTLALETEAGGVGQAFYETVGDGSSVIAWFTLRGISDLADEEKDDSFHDIASQRAAAVLAKMMSFLATPSES